MSNASTSATSSSFGVSPSGTNSSTNSNAPGSSGSSGPVRSGSSSVDDLRNAKFTSAFRGYDSAEVRAFLQRMANRFETELGLSERVKLTPVANDVELVLDEAAYLAAAEAGEVGGTAGGGGVDLAQPVQNADEVLLAARSEYETILASARNEANAIVVKANDEAARIILRARAESRGKPSAESSAVVEAAYAQAASDPVLAREQARLMIAEARAVRERILTDLNKRRRVAHVQLEQLRVAREKLTETLREARRIVDDSARDLSTAEVEARLAADAAGRRISAEALPSIGELEVELWGGRHMPSAPTFASSSTPVSDADDSFETASPASTTNPTGTLHGEVLRAPTVEALTPTVLATNAESTKVSTNVSTKVSTTEGSLDTDGESVASAVFDDQAPIVSTESDADVADVAVSDVAVSEVELTEVVVSEVELSVVAPLLSDAVISDSRMSGASVSDASVSEAVVAEVMVAESVLEDSARAALVLSVPMIEDSSGGAAPLVVDLSAAESVETLTVDVAGSLSDVVTKVEESGEILVDAPSVAEATENGKETAENKKRPANVDDLFARLRADRERAAAEARSVLGVKESDGGQSTTGAVLDLRSNGGASDSGSGGPGGEGGSGGAKRAKGSPKPARNGGNSVAAESQTDAGQTGGVAVLDRTAGSGERTNSAGVNRTDHARSLNDTDEHVTAIVLDLRAPTSSEQRVGSQSTFDDSQDTVSEADDGMDFVVGPLHSSLIRTVKRRLHDEQSSILALLRSYRGTLDVDRLLGSVQDHQLRLIAEIRPIFVDAFRVGAQKTGATMSDHDIDDLLREHIDSVAASVTATIRNEVETIVSAQGGSDSRALGESLTSTYRTWTTERIGTVVTGAVFETYRLGTAA